MYVWSVGAKMWAQGIFFFFSFCGEPSVSLAIIQTCLLWHCLVIALLQFGTRPMLWVFHAQQNHRLAVNRGSRI